MLTVKFKNYTKIGMAVLEWLLITILIKLCLMHNAYSNVRNIFLRWVTFLMVFNDLFISNLFLDHFSLLLDHLMYKLQEFFRLHDWISQEDMSL